MISPNNSALTAVIVWVNSYCRLSLCDYPLHVVTKDTLCCQVLYISANTMRWYNDVLMLSQRRRRWASIKHNCFNLLCLLEFSHVTSYDSHFVFLILIVDWCTRSRDMAMASTLFSLLITLLVIIYTCFYHGTPNLSIDVWYQNIVYQI